MKRQRESVFTMIEVICMQMGQNEVFGKPHEEVLVKYRAPEVRFWVKKGFPVHVVQYGISKVWIRHIEGLEWIQNIHFRGYGISMYAVSALLAPIIVLAIDVDLFWKE
nr:hypothetical protein [Tanacetum cinerariifolium]